MIALTDKPGTHRFRRGPSLGTRFVLLMLLSLAVMFMDHRFQQLETIRRVLSFAVTPIQKVVDLPFAIAEWLGTNMAERSSLIDENTRLINEQLKNSVRLQRVASLEAENARLRALLDSTARVPDRTLIAEILRADLDRFRHRILINKGDNQNAYAGQALIDARGIVGQITRANPFTSEAILISDAAHATPVEVNRNGLRTIAVGIGDATRLSLPFLPNTADIDVGDLLVSSGLGGVFPTGYPVARVSSIERRPGEAFAKVSAIPTAALDRIKDVLLVWVGEMVDISPTDSVDNMTLPEIDR